MFKEYQGLILKHILTLNKVSYDLCLKNTKVWY